MSFSRQTTNEPSAQSDARFRVETLKRTERRAGSRRERAASATAAECGSIDRPAASESDPEDRRPETLSPETFDHSTQRATTAIVPSRFAGEKSIDWGTDPKRQSRPRLNHVPLT